MIGGNMLFNQLILAQICDLYGQMRLALHRGEAMTPEERKQRRIAIKRRAELAAARQRAFAKKRKEAGWTGTMKELGLSA